MAQTKQPAASETKPEATQEKKSSDNSGKQAQLGNLEEDDEFEEFPVEEWIEDSEDDIAMRLNNSWDDDDVEEDFSALLRDEKSSVSMS